MTPIPPLLSLRWQLHPEATIVAMGVAVSATIVEVVDAEPIVADKTIIIKIVKIKATLTKILQTMYKSLTKKVLAMLTGPQIQVAPVTGPKAGERPTAPTP